MQTNTTNTTTKKILSTCRFTSSDFAFGDNGENAKTAPCHIMARSGDPVDYPLYGYDYPSVQVVHDFEGMQSRNRGSIDYEHGPIIGYWNKVDYSTGDLWVNGVIESALPNDIAQEVINRGKNQPYEASILAETLCIEEVDQGKQVQVNNRTIYGPVVVIREWKFRALAVCKCGADSNTTTEMNNKDSMTECKLIKGNTQMIDENKTVEAIVELAVETEPVVEVVNVETVETEKVVETVAEVVNVETVETEVKPDVVEAEVVEAETVEQVEQTVVETVVEASEAQPEIQPVVELRANEIMQMKSDYDSQLTALKAENDALRSRLVCLGVQGESKPVAFSVPSEDDKPLNLEKFLALTKQGVLSSVARIAANIVLPK